MAAKKVVVITGCSKGGIGDSLARAFAEQGCHVFATVRNPSKAAHFSDVANVDVVELDVTSKESIAAAVDVVRAKASPGGNEDGFKVDVLINNAGFGSSGPLLEVDLDSARKILDTNVWGVLAVTQAFKEPLKRAKGKIVNISSVGALYNTPWLGVYSASKAAVTLLSETLRVEVAPLGITVITGMLGAIESNFHKNDQWPGLSDNSDYKSIESYVAAAAEGTIGPQKQDINVFTKNLIKDISGSTTGQTWRGSFASLVRYTGYHLPASLLDWMLRPGSGLQKLGK